jgi:hypothetical protein
MWSRNTRITRGAASWLPVADTSDARLIWDFWGTGEERWRAEDVGSMRA